MSTACVPLKHIAGINERALPETTDPHLEFRYVDIGSVGQGELVVRPAVIQFKDAPSRARRLVKAGDTIISTVRTYLRAVWPVSADSDDLVVSTGFAVLTPRSIEPNYFSWFVRSDDFIDEVVARSVGVSYPAINALDLGDIPVQLPTIAEQRAIADYLDTETARIDALITKKRRMIDSLGERLRAEVDSLLWRGETTRLKHVADLLPGYAFPSDEFDPEFDGAPLVRGTNIGVGRIDWTDTVRLSTDGAAFARYRIREGDVLLGMDRPFIRAGTRVTLASSDADGSLLVQRVCRIRPREPSTSVLIMHAIQSRRFAAYIESDLTGVSVPHLSDEQIGDFRVPAICGSGDSRLVEHLNRAQEHEQRVTDRLTEQIDLLAERRQALITAAVTGELDIPGVAA